jgi:hypothetical protein
MTANDKCKRIQEQFPLLFNQSLSEQEAAKVRDHLSKCPLCKSLFEKEQALFHVASSGNNCNPLDEHPQAELLDSYASNPKLLSSSQLKELETHIARCELCRDIVQKLQQLPGSLEEIVADDEVPMLSSLAGAQGREEADHKITGVTRHRQWRSIAALAAAAVIVLVAISLMRPDREPPMAKVQARFPTIVRSNGSSIVFESDKTSFVFQGEAYVGPEDGHMYSLRVVSLRNDSVLFHQEQVSNFDSLGFVQFELPMEIGRYQLVLLDIEADDTLVIRHPFEIRLKE